MRVRVLSPWLVVAAASFAPTVQAQVVNAPVAPDTIYVARVGSHAGLSVIDLNGFGASTGDPTYDPLVFREGHSNYPNNPNVQFQGALLRPSLAPGTTTLDGGSAGVFTLTKNSFLEDVLLRAPDVLSISDMMLGQPLDLTFNDGPAPFGCQAGGGSLCASDPLEVLTAAAGGPNTLVPASPGSIVVNFVVGGGNPISWAPHPNPPPLLAVPLCQSPFLGGQEPTSIDSSTQVGLSNLLGPGDPFGDPLHGVPPTGLLTAEQNTFFVGPSLPQPVISLCSSYTYRQQVGHWLYLADRARGEVVAVNSNTFEVLKRIPVEDPTEFAMDTNLRRLAVTSQATNRVVFIDIDPRSASFHRIVHATTVGQAPRGIAWDPGDEDILVCNEGDDTVSILSAANLGVRKVVHRGLDRPFAVAITQRQTAFGFQRNVYFAYILDRAGHVSLFESGPNGVNGWGYDEIIGRAPTVFANPRAIQPDPLRLESGVWIAHAGAVTNLVLDSATIGALPLNPVNVPNMRGLSFRIARSITSELSGEPADIAFDDQRNFGALPNFVPYGGGGQTEINGKSLVRQLSGSYVNTNEATFLFVPVRGAGVVDVISLATGRRVDTSAYHPGVQSVAAPGAALVMDYFRE
jgi:hypothetical protein